MKNLLLIFFITLLSIGCKKKDNGPFYASRGTILGEDLRMCALCGGLKIAIENDTTKNAPAFYLIDETHSASLNFGPNPKYPINVTLDWKHDTSFYSNTFIIITRIRAIN
ncbi:MAG TPA: hypothetical protein VNW95_07420 [Mucilaginibacter sp.]|jgi:hypothetical protein|nr:hypothetical protein [Mucilaginibacter sp.]